MLNAFKDTIKEVAQAVLPIVTIITLVLLWIPGTTIEGMIQFLIGTLMIMIGIVFFLVGVKVGLFPMGEAIGAELPKMGSIPLIVIVALVFGFLATVAEPDIWVLANLYDSVSNGEISKIALVIIIATGSGFFVSTALLRILYGVPFTYLLTAGYSMVILLSLLTDVNKISIAFDSGSVAIGPINGPIILALGIGVTSILGGRSALSDGFGYMGLASIGPILGVMLIGVL